jgi:hypothetical protein
VGSPDYVKTPVFEKRVKVAATSAAKSADKGDKKKRPGNAIDNTIGWETVRSFQTTKLEEKQEGGIYAIIDALRAHLNKLTDKTYLDIRLKVFDIMDSLLRSDHADNGNLTRISEIVFEIASNNRFFSQIYADLYSDLLTRYEIMRPIFEENLEKFTELFNAIEYVEPSENYDKFCEINKTNEKRKSLAAFYVNLMNNRMITVKKIVAITRNLLQQIYSFVHQENMKNQTDELAENVAILYNNKLFMDYKYDATTELIDGKTIPFIIQLIAKSKVKDFKSLTNKTLFKFMDMIDM